MLDGCKAYRALVDRQRFAVIHATNLLEAGEIFRDNFPEVERAPTLSRLPWLDGNCAPRTCAVLERQIPLR